MTDSAMPWVKVYNDILNDLKVGRLTKAARWTFIGFLVLAGECDAEGYIVQGDSPLTRDEIAWKLRDMREQLDADLKELITQGLIRDEDGTLLVVNFGKRQGRSQTEKREQWRAHQAVRRDKVRHIVFERAGGRCEYCAKPIGTDAFVVDHITPPFRGGSYTDLNNLACSCQSCNSIKGDKTPEELGWHNPRSDKLKSKDDSPKVINDSNEVINDSAKVILLEKRREKKKKRREEFIADAPPSIRTIPSSAVETVTEPPRFTGDTVTPIESTPHAAQPHKQTPNYRPIFGWLQSLTRLNAISRIGRIAKEIDATGADIETCQRFERYWWACDWRGQKQQRPTPEQVWEIWPRALDWDGKTTVRVNSNGRADEPAGFRAIREAMADPRYKQAQERKKNG